jgi:murein DD-endopeptidase MepM/ murein hydrolase activator NlpD
MILKNWKSWVQNKSELVISHNTAPLPIKEVAWKAIYFASKCGRSNPLSFALRPLVSHQKIRQAVGLNLVLMAVLASVVGTVPLQAESENESMQVVSIPDNQISLTTQLRIKFPIPQRDISQRFWLLHQGVDLRTPVGTPVSAMMSGIVVETEADRFGYGNKVVIDHGNGYETLYAHLSKIEVKKGEKVTTDSILGESGNTGRSTGPHLHLELREHGKPINPLVLLGSK